ncbi:MAG: protein kinase domain-containing protein [Acidobacteriota bacterium]
MNRASYDRRPGGDALTLTAGTRLGPYAITTAIGAGGMGEVYRARDTRLDRDVAVKVLPAHLTQDSSALARFRREARAVAALSHPNILALYDIGEEQGVVFAVTELLTGETLGARLTRGPLPLAEALACGTAIADGLAAAHERGLVHRGVKPDNLFMTVEGRVKILDFGVAKTAAAAGNDGPTGVTLNAHTMPGTIIGTIGYMSPEQVRGDDVDARSDLFSLGAVLYELITGRRAFAGKSGADTISAILTETPPELARDAGAIPAGLGRVLRRCLAKEPSARYASALELRAALVEAARAGDRSESAASIAVLPFIDMSPGKDQDYFCEGMAEELINGLMRIEGLRVAARSSAFQFKGHTGDVRRVGEALDVKTVLEGSVRTAGQRLRVTAQLNDAVKGFQIWSKRYDREMDDVFAIQDEIASDIVEALQLQLGGSHPAPRLKRYTDNLEAYHLYLQGRYHWFARTKGGLQRALQYFEQAIEKDPSYALAYSGQADLHAVQAIYGFVPPHQAFSRASRATEQALALDPALPEGHFSAAARAWCYDFDWLAAERHFRRAIELNPNNSVAHCWYAHMLCYLGRLDEETAERERAQAIDPLSAYINSMAGLQLVGERRYEEALVECRKALDTEPDYLVALYSVTGAYSRLGRHDEAIAAMERAVSLADRASFYLGILGATYAEAGHVDRARRVLDELDERARHEWVSPLWISWLLAALGELDRAFELLDRAYEERQCFLALPGFAPFDGLRRDPRFAAHLRRMGLPE